MKSRKTRFTALALVALTSALFLGACGGQKQATTTTSSSKTSQSTKASSAASSSSKAKSDKKTQASSSATEKANASENAGQDKPASSEKVTEEAKVPSSNNQSPDSKQDNNPAKTSTEATIDYSIVAGTWKNEAGETITINSDGTVSDGSKLENGEQRDGYYHAGIRFPEGAGAAVFYATSGQEFPEAIASKQFTEKTDINRERLVIGQSEDAMARPYYRAE